VRFPADRLQGEPATQVVNPATVDNPGMLDYYTRLGEERRTSH